MDGVRHIRTIRLDGMLSYSPGTPELPLEPVNVLIGPNGSGKSNLIEGAVALGSRAQGSPVADSRGGWCGRVDMEGSARAERGGLWT